MATLRMACSVRDPHAIRELNARRVVADCADEARATAQSGNADCHVGRRATRTDMARIADDTGSPNVARSPIGMARHPHPDVEVGVPHGQHVE